MDNDYFCFLGLEDGFIYGRENARGSLLFDIDIDKIQRVTEGNGDIVIELNNNSSISLLREYSGPEPIKFKNSEEIVSFLNKAIASREDNGSYPRISRPYMEMKVEIELFKLKDLTDYESESLRLAIELAVATTTVPGTRVFHDPREDMQHLLMEVTLEERQVSLSVSGMVSETQPGLFLNLRRSKAVTSSYQDTLLILLNQARNVVHLLADKS